MPLDILQKSIVFNKSYDLAKGIYKLTKKFPSSERYGLVSQINRSAMSIPVNIAEGKGRRTNNDFVRFLYISRGSCSELITHLMFARDFGYISLSDFDKLRTELREIVKILNAAIRTLSNH